MAESLVREQVGAGQVVFQQGDVGDRFYLIRSGAVQVLVDRGAGQQQTALLTAGDFFGEVALVTGEPRNATIRSTEAGELYSLDKPTFLCVLEGRESLRERLLKVMFQRQ